MCKEAAHDAMPATKKYSVGIHSSALHCEPRFVQLVAYQNTHVGDEQSHRTSSLIVCYSEAERKERGYLKD